MIIAAPQELFKIVPHRYETASVGVYGYGTTLAFAVYVRRCPTGGQGALVIRHEGEGGRGLFPPGRIGSVHQRPSGIPAVRPHRHGGGARVQPERQVAQQTGDPTSVTIKTVSGIPININN